MNPLRYKNAGAVLIICLVFLLVMTVIAASVMQSSMLQERMAGNARDTHAAFQAAEAALRSAEAQLASAALGAFEGRSGRYLQCDVGVSLCNTPEWNDRSASGWITLADYRDELYASPQYFIEKLSNFELQNVSLEADSAVQHMAVYRVTARGFGVSDKSMVVLRSIYRRE